MKLFIADINSLKEKFIKIGLSENDIKNTLSVLMKNNQIGDLEDSKKKDSREAIPNLECNFKCQAAGEMLTLESLIKDYIGKGVKKIIKWLSPLYAGSLVLLYVAFKPQIHDLAQKIYCYVCCSDILQHWFK